jgi:hypothetical protein
MLSGLLSGHILVEDVPKQEPEGHSVHASGRDRRDREAGDNEFRVIIGRAGEGDIGDARGDGAAHGTVKLWDD